MSSEVNREYEYSFISPRLIAICPDISDAGVQKSDPTHTQGPLFKDQYVLQWITKGKGIYEIGGKTYHLRAGDLFYLPRNILLSYHTDPIDPYYYHWLGLVGGSCPDLLQRAGLSAENPVIRPDGETGDLITKAAEAVFENSYAGGVRAQGLLMLFFSRILALREENTRPLLSPVGQYVNNGLRYIWDNYNSFITVSDIAAHVGLGRSYFSVIFKQETGLSPANYLLQYRIDQACKMLKNEATVTEAAYGCGFGALSNFSVQFKRLMGVTPVSYRIQHKNDVR